MCFGGAKASEEGKRWPRPWCWSQIAGASPEGGGGSGQVTLSRSDSEQKHVGEALAVF